MLFLPLFLLLLFCGALSCVQVREATIALLVDMMNEATSPHSILGPFFKDLDHKNWRVRASLLNLYLATLEKSVNCRSNKERNMRGGGMGMHVATPTTALLNVWL